MPTEFHCSTEKWSYLGTSGIVGIWTGIPCIMIDTTGQKTVDNNVLERDCLCNPRREWTFRFLQKLRSFSAPGYIRVSSQNCLHHIAKKADELNNSFPSASLTSLSLDLEDLQWISDRGTMPFEESYTQFPVVLFGFCFHFLLLNLDMPPETTMQTAWHWGKISCPAQSLRWDWRWNLTAKLNLILMIETNNI